MDKLTNHVSHYIHCMDTDAKRFGELEGVFQDWLTRTRANLVTTPARQDSVDVTHLAHDGGKPNSALSLADDPSKPVGANRPVRPSDWRNEEEGSNPEPRRRIKPAAFGRCLVPKSPRYRHVLGPRCIRFGV